MRADPNKALSIVAAHQQERMPMGKMRRGTTPLDAAKTEPSTGKNVFNLHGAEIDAPWIKSQGLICQFFKDDV